jgi:hypothetical protein
MDKAKARKMYELADRLSKVDTSKLNEQELSERDAMIQRLAQEAQAMKQGVAEAEEDLHTSFNVVKLGGALNADPRTLRAAITRHMQGSPTRTDIMTLANAFMSMLKNSDDQQIQQIANLIKSGNPREVPQESTAAIAERNAFVDAMRQVKKGEKFTVGGKEFTKTTSHGEDEVKEAVDTEAYDRLKKVFDFSDYKG